ncbi:hypothetical protein [Tsuneonella sp. HG222]
MPRIASAAALYFAAIFALGFVLGSARVLWLAPRLGQVSAVLLELPLMLAVSWLAARRLTRRYHVADARDALAMGGLAFALLLATELAFALALGSSAGEWLTGLGETPGLIGLVGQAGFGLMPVAVRGRG